MRRRLLLAETLAALTLASVLIAVLPFRRIVRAVARRTAPVPASPATAGAIDRALHHWSVRVPWHTMCFQQGLAAQLMLRRRRRAATVYYGARHDDGRLVAHVWVRSGTVDVTGCEGADRFGLLATFPAED